MMIQKPAQKAGAHRKRRINFRDQRGAASILVILMILLLAFFSILPLVAAGAEMRLARRRAVWNQQFYAVDAFAEQVYGQLQAFARDPVRAKQTPAERGADLEQLLMRERIEQTVIENTPQGFAIALVVTAPDSPQKIRLRLQMRVPSIEEEDPVTILSWVQEQTAPTAAEATGGVWQG